jgi:hypothetical protein
MILKVKAEYVNVVKLNNISVLVVFNVQESNAREFKKGDRVDAVKIEDDTGPWVNKVPCTFMSYVQGNMTPQHLKVELVYPF